MSNRIPPVEFEELAEMCPPESVPAPPKLKSRIFSALNLRQAKSGPLASLTESKASARGLCIFEELVQIAPVGERVKSVNYCRVCHARVLAEHLDRAPIYWPHCPYAGFQKP